MRTTFSTWTSSTVEPPARFKLRRLPQRRTTTQGSESGSFHGVCPPTAFARGSWKITRSPSSIAFSFRHRLASSARRSDVAAYQPATFALKARYAWKAACALSDNV
eukprot:1263342-Alexandrium_andersonii.AAC.1